MSSLAQQLQRLAVPQTANLAIHDKERKSLLFDPKEAANFDKETFFSIGINGLEELASINPVFRGFEKSLFNENAQNFQRAVQTKEVNEKLDETITEFLLQLSPYFLLKPAQKAVEWLVFRYQIHLYNTDSIMLCILPYHESKIFVRALQLIKLDGKIKTMWDWLLPIQESGVYLPRSSLINHCGTNPAFLAFICDMVPKYIQVHTNEDGETMTKQLRVIFSFYSTTIIGVLEKRPITEKIISGLIPYLTRGLKSPIEEYKAATYMIIAQLLYKAQLKEKLLTMLLNTISKNMIPSLLTEGIMCIIIMFQTQENITKLTKKSFKYLARQNRLVSILEQLSIVNNIDDLLLPLLLRLVHAGVKQTLTGDVTMDTSEDESGPSAPVFLLTVREIMTKITLHERIATEMASAVIESYIQHGSNLDPNDPSGESLNLNMKNVVSSLETRYPASLDVAIEKIKQEVEGTDQQQAVDQFLLQSVVSVKRQIVPDLDSNLFLCLNHRSEFVRIRSVQQLLKNKDRCEDKEFISESLLARMVDDSPLVVKTVFKNSTNLENLILDKQQLQSNLLTILKTHRDEDIEHDAIKVLVSIDSGDLQMAGSVLLSYLCSLDKPTFSLDQLALLLDSPIARNYLPLSQLKSKWLPLVKKNKNMSSAAWNMKLINVIKETLLQNTDKLIPTLQGLLDQVKTSPCPLRLKFILCLILQEITANKDDDIEILQARYLLLQHIQTSFQNEESEIETSIKVWSSLEDIVNNSIKCIVQNTKLPMSLYLSLLTSVVETITVPQYLIESVFWQYDVSKKVKENNWLKLVIKLLDLLLQLASNSHVTIQAQKLVITLLQTKFEDQVLRLNLFGLIWTQHVNDYSNELGLNVTLQARCLQLGQIYIRSLETLQSPLPVIVNLLIVCTSKHAALREVSVNCLNILVHILPDTASKLRQFIRTLLNTEEEIVNDPTYLSQCIKGVSIKNDKNIGSAKKRRRSNSEGTDKDFLTIVLNMCIHESIPPYITKSILDITSLVDNLECFYITRPLLERYISQTSLTLVESDCLALLLKRYTETISSSLSDKSPEIHILCQALTISRKPHHSRPAVQELALKQITRVFYDDLPTLESKQLILNSLITAWKTSTDVNVSNMVKKVLKHITLQAENIINELSPVLQTSNINSVRQAKKVKRQIKDEETVSLFETDNWKRVLILLEAIQEKKKIENAPKLVPLAFQLLTRILESDDHINGEYIKQLVLSTLYFICSRHLEEIKSSGLKAEQFNLEMIVQCIRTSDNPQTHHQALLVLTVAAKIQPGQLLHNVMSVFTFMGANTLRQDNTYSFHIISQILETVIPVVTSACEETTKSPKSGKKDEEKKPEMIIGMILRIFVDAYPHIPEHRKLMLFSKLIQIVSPDKYLWHCLLLFIEQVATKGRQTSIEDDDEDSKQAGPISTTDLDFILKLATSFPLVTQISSVKTMISFIASLPVEKDDVPLQPSINKTKYTTDVNVITDEAKIFNLATHTAKQLRHFKYATFYLLCQHLQCESFLAQMANHQEEELLPNFQKYLEKVLQYLSQAARNSELCQQKSDSKFHKVLLHKVYDLLDKVVSLLPDVMFVQVISGLMDHDLAPVQRKSMELLNTKLHQIKESQSSAQSELLLQLVEKLNTIAKLTLLVESEEEKTLNGQTALYSLKLLCRMLASKNPKPFVEVLKLSSEVLKKRRENSAICATVLLCIAELCTCLKVHVIQYLPLFVPQVIEMVAQDDSLLDNELLTLSFATALLCVVQNLPQFLSPYLLDILHQVCRISYFADGDNPQRPQLKIRLQLVRHLLATSLPSRVILPCIFNCYDLLVTTDWPCLVFVMSILKEHISEMKKEDLDSYQNQLIEFFYKAFDFRIKYSQTIEESGIITIEDSVIQTMTSMVMKMSEASFRPMMFKIFDWCTRDNNKDRILVLYRLSDYLVETLRSLFMIVAGPIVNYTAQILDLNNSSKTKERYFGKGKVNSNKQNVLITSILDCLSKCFLYDNEGFLTTDRFETVMQPIVDQIDNLPFNKKENVYKNRITNSLVPCIGNLVLAAHDDSLWKKLNYQILLKTRHSDALVRMAALEIEDEFHKKLGPDFMSLLPETIPFLAELMEDDNEEVESKCHRVIVEMEKTLGEPLQKYF